MVGLHGAILLDYIVYRLIIIVNPDFVTVPKLVKGDKRGALRPKSCSFDQDQAINDTRFKPFSK